MVKVVHRQCDACCVSELGRVHTRSAWGSVLFGVQFGHNYLKGLSSPLRRHNANAGFDLNWRSKHRV